MTGNVSFIILKRYIRQSTLVATKYFYFILYLNLINVKDIRQSTLVATKYFYFILNLNVINVKDIRQSTLVATKYFNFIHYLNLTNVKDMCDLNFYIFVSFIVHQGNTCSETHIISNMLCLFWQNLICILTKFACLIIIKNKNL